MSPLSSSTLFHFTRRLEHLLGILRDEFRPHFSLEDFGPIFGTAFPDRDMRVALPMVCFCDMPLSQAAAHMSIYGRYAIGLTKDWGMAAGVSPVLYTYSGSATTEATLFLHLKIEDLQDTLDDDASFHPRTERLLCFLKPYSAQLLRHGKQPMAVRFYDEREWRYVPADGWRGQSHEQFRDEHHRQAANEALWPQCCLSFEPSDIRYIIVEREHEIPRVIKEIQRIKSRKYDTSDIELLCSRVVSAQQILADF